MLYSGYFCDRCGKAVEYKRESCEWLPFKTHIIRWAREAGWTVGRKIICPKCKAEGKSK